ncbi:hypothetical protein KAX21_07310, partial [candidate division WOR-3 bacterium]|nr:hypothetical protein [candidate division WOR-3 bacterium]
MKSLSILFSLLATFWPEERSGLERHPVMDFDNLIIEDTSLACDVLHYNLALDVDIPAETLSAAAQITLKMLEPADSVALHFVGMTVSDVKEGSSSRSFDRLDSSLVVSLGRTAPAGEVITLAVSYHGKPTRASGGFGRGMYIDPSSDDDAV